MARYTKEEQDIIDNDPGLKCYVKDMEDELARLLETVVHGERDAPSEKTDFVKNAVKEAVALGKVKLGESVSLTLQEMEKLSADSFQKHDEGKRRYELLQYDALDEIVKALEFGAKKYTDYNWLKGTHWSRYFGACMRHLTAWWSGESRDPDSGLTHLAHAGACILFLITYEKRLLGKDDRFTPTDE